MKMTKYFIAALFATSQVVTAQEPTTVWNMDKSHSSISFSVDHMVVSEITGNFEDFLIDVKSDKQDFTDVVFNVTIQVKSIDTKVTRRDDHLRSPDFFDVVKYPVITFKGTKIVKVSGNAYKITGDLTMHGVTKTLTLDAKIASVTDPYAHTTRTGIKVSGELDRYEFGLKYNSVLEGGGVVVGQTIKILCSVEFLKAKS
jgi:polyisoprenoid-binding protein YceI